jgi:RNA polymerase sigma-32 factor
MVAKKVKTKRAAKSLPKKRAKTKVLEPEIISAKKPEAEQTGLARLDPMAKYMAEIQRYPLLTKEEEHSLALKYRESGDAQAAQTLVTANLRFVVKIAAEYAKFGAKLIDLIQEGNIGLMHAVKEFNPHKGTRLITYAVWWIRGFIQEYLMRQYSMVRIGTTQAQRKLFYQLQKERELLRQLGQEGSVAQLSGRLGVSEKDVKTMSERLSGRDVSLNAPFSDEDSGTLLDVQASPSSETAADDSLALREQLSLLEDKIQEIRPSLSEKETLILDKRLLADEPLTLQEIGDQYGITREAVRQLEARLIQKLRATFE